MIHTMKATYETITIYRGILINDNNHRLNFTSESKAELIDRMNSHLDDYKIESVKVEISKRITDLNLE